MNLTPRKRYRHFIERLDKACQAIQDTYADDIACRKGCAGNCCRIHLSIFAVEAFALAHALKKLPLELSRHIRKKATNATGYGACPLLEDGACLMYASRLVICRTHGLPMLSEYRGHRSIGFCQKNFRNLNSIPNNAVIDLNELNAELAALNRAFVDSYQGQAELRDRFTISEALLLDYQ